MDELRKRVKDFHREVLSQILSDEKVDESEHNECKENEIEV